jgi:hypothetical protein
MFTRLLLDQPDQRVQAVFFLEQVADQVRDGRDMVAIIIGEHRQHINDAGDRDQFAVGHVLVRGGGRHHHGDKGILRAEGIDGHGVISFGGIFLGAWFLWEVIDPFGSRQ